MDVKKIRHRYSYIHRRNHASQRKTEIQRSSTVLSYVQQYKRKHVRARKEFICTFDHICGNKTRYKETETRQYILVWLLILKRIQVQIYTQIIVETLSNYQHNHSYEHNYDYDRNFDYNNESNKNNDNGSINNNNYNIRKEKRITDALCD